jgi:23S rRNA pseudouridine2605 synthase
MVIARGNMKKNQASGAKSGIGKPKRRPRIQNADTDRPKRESRFKPEGADRPKRESRFKPEGADRPKRESRFKPEGADRPKRESRFKPEGAERPKRESRFKPEGADRPKRESRFKPEGAERPKRESRFKPEGADRPKRESRFKPEGADKPKRESRFKPEGTDRPKRESRFKPEGTDRPKRGPEGEGGGPARFTKEPRRAKPYTERRVRSGSTREQPKPGEDKPIRLNKYLAGSGICSRREADEYIKAGLVAVNGALVTELGTRINPGDVVKYNGEVLKEERKVYVLMNKPKDFVTTTDDPHAKKTVLDLVRGACRERIYPVGRLDRNTTGVLLLTNDGELTRRLTHPKFEKLKIYHVHLNKNLKGPDLEKVASGINLDDGFIKADAVSYIDSEDKSQVGLEIHSGRNHIVRRIFESLGYEVVKLDRVYFAGLTKKNLQRGEWRHLNEKEVNMLKMNAYK